MKRDTSRRAAIVIPVHNRKAVTLRCLSVLRADGVFDWAHIIVVDDGSTDGTQAAIRELFEAVVVLTGNGNLWWTGAIRHGMKHLDEDSTRCFFWLNDDCLPAPGTMLRLFHRTLESNDIIYAAQCVDPETGQASYGGGRFAGRRLVPLHCEDSETLHCDWLPGNLVCFPASVLRKIGLPDDRTFPHYYGDAAFTLLARRHGYRLALAGDCRATCTLTRNDFSILLSDFTIGEMLRQYLRKESGYYWRAQLGVFQIALGKARGTAAYAAGIPLRHAGLLLCRLALPKMARRWVKAFAARRRDIGPLGKQLPACPLCSSRRLGLHLDQVHWKILSCRHCTNAFTWPQPQPVDYASRDFHADTLKSNSASYEDLPVAWRVAVQKQVSLLGRTLERGAKILEIGCGQGIFLERLARSGFRVAGMEASFSAVRRARERGLDVSQGEFPSDCPPGPYDAIVLAHVLEHIASPYEVFAQIERLAPGGAAFFIQSNWRGLIPQVYLQKWYAWMPDEHFWHFSPKGLRTMLENRGWKILAIEHSTLAHDPRNALANLARQFPIVGDQFHLLAKVPVRDAADFQPALRGLAAVSPAVGQP